MICQSDWKARLYALFIISVVEYSAQVVMPLVPRNDLYYGACAAFNLATLAILTVTERKPIMVDLVRLTFAQLLLQFTGWVLYTLYLPAQYYNASIQFIVVATYVRIFWIGRYDGNHENYFDRLLVLCRRFLRGNNPSEVH